MAIAESAPRTEIAQPEFFHYEKPEIKGEKSFFTGLRSERGSMNIQVLYEGGEDNLHAHPHSDGFWFVLKGRARFYTVNDRFVAEIGENEGILTPRGYAYWFEAVTDFKEELQIIRCGTSDYVKKDERVGGRLNLEPLKPNQDATDPGLQGGVFTGDVWQ